LRDEPSLYLRQHAHNPVDWFPWGVEALTRAAALDQPIFLSVGYASCHWCHVMEKEAFDDDGIADFLNRHYVCIKVDREERPDLDAVYMDAVQALTGHGGWPMSAFLTPAGLPFHGGTYFRPAHFRQVIEQIAHLWRERPQDLREQAAKVTAQAVAVPAWAGADADALNDRPLAAAAARAADLFDDEHGGFRQRQKFPTPVKWRFLLQRWRQTGDSGLRTMLTRTLEAMAGRGLRDHLGGGFHRYTVDPAWAVPHFEKMLYDNAQLASLYLEAGEGLDRPDLTGVAHDTLTFLCREMRDPAGGLFASFDADSGGQEGSYYVWSAAEIAAVVGPADGAAVCALLGVTRAGNFEDSGSSVLSRHLVGEETERTPAAVDENESLFARHRPALLAARARRTPPGLDRKVVTGWNGLAIAALARGSVVCGEPAFAAAATTAADFLLTRHLRADGTLWRTSSDGQTSGEGIVDDYACLADGLLELFLATGSPRWLSAARALADTARRRFAHPDGGWYLTAEGAEAPLGRTIELFDSVVPTGNAVLLQVLLKLTALTGETIYADEAAATLTARAGLLERGGLETVGWLQAAALVLTPPFTVVVAGESGDAATDALTVEARRVRPAPVLTVCVPADGAGADLVAVAPALGSKPARAGRPTAYVCRGRTCAEPAQEPQTLRAQLGG
jgi:uncharacterized protein YyaL (SSP411 family)